MAEQSASKNQSVITVSGPDASTCLRRLLQTATLFHMVISCCYCIMMSAHLLIERTSVDTSDVWAIVMTSMIFPGLTLLPLGLEESLRLLAFLRSDLVGATATADAQNLRLQDSQGLERKFSWRDVCALEIGGIPIGQRSHLRRVLGVVTHPLVHIRFSTGDVLRIPSHNLFTHAHSDYVNLLCLAGEWGLAAASGRGQVSPEDWRRLQAIALGEDSASHRVGCILSLVPILGGCVLAVGWAYELLLREHFIGATIFIVIFTIFIPIFTVLFRNAFASIGRGQR